MIISVSFSQIHIQVKVVYIMSEMFQNGGTTICHMWQSESTSFIFTKNCIFSVVSGSETVVDQFAGKVSLKFVEFQKSLPTLLKVKTAVVTVSSLSVFIMAFPLVKSKLYTLCNRLRFHQSVLHFFVVSSATCQRQYKFAVCCSVSLGPNISSKAKKKLYFDFHLNPMSNVHMELGCVEHC